MNVLEYENYQEKKEHVDASFPYNTYLCSIPLDFSKVPLHWHEEMEIIYVTEGVISVSLGNNEYALSVGDIILVHPQTIHAIRQHNEDSARYYNILFRFSMLENAADDTCREKISGADLQSHTVDAGISDSGGSSALSD